MAKPRIQLKVRRKACVVALPTPRYSQTIGMLEQWLKDAREGKVCAVAAVALTAEGCLRHGWTDPGFIYEPRSLRAMLGQIEILKADMVLCDSQLSYHEDEG